VKKRAGEVEAANADFRRVLQLEADPGQREKVEELLQPA